MTEMARQQSPLLEVEIQVALDDAAEEPPGTAELSHWAQMAYAAVAQIPSEITLRLVDEPEMTALNRAYRGQDKPTNVLSFEFEIDPDINISLLGDVVICHPVVVLEAQQQNKRLRDHYAHMVTHGILHLCGYDHQDEPTARRMEKIEKQVLAEQGIADPYLTD